MVRNVSVALTLPFLYKYRRIRLCFRLPGCLPNLADLALRALKRRRGLGPLKALV